MRAVLFKKELGGIDNAEQEPSKELAVYTNVFVLVDRFACLPICLINAMVMIVRAQGKIYIERVTFNAHMITKVVGYICDEDNWPAHMTKEEMIAAACSNYSMHAMDLLAMDMPHGLSDPVTWFVYELPMAQHGFVAYLLEIYLVVAVELGALDVAKDIYYSNVRAALIAVHDTRRRHGADERDEELVRYRRHGSPDAEPRSW